MQAIPVLYSPQGRHGSASRRRMAGGSLGRLFCDARWHHCHPDLAHALELTITNPAEWVVVFDQQPEAAGVEPQSGRPNGINTHPRPRTASDPLELSTTWAWCLLD